MNYRHGKARTKIYGVWRAMKSRCQNPNDAAYHNYGARGIKVCEAWDDFANFYRDMGEPPRGGNLERTDNGRDYGPDNCVWASRTDQNRNKRNVRSITAHGLTLTLPEWAERTGIKYGTIHQRIRDGWPDDKAVTVPTVRERKGVPRNARHFGAKRGVVFHDQKETAA